MKIYSLKQCAEYASDLFRTFKEGPPDLIPLGFSSVDSIIAGLPPGAGGVLGADTGIGKSSLVLRALIDSPVPAGVVSLEDTADVLGSRVWSHMASVDSLKIRRKELTKSESNSLKKELQNLEKYDSKVKVAVAVAAPIEEVLEAIQGLAEQGCKLIWIDYLQNVRGAGNDRRHEVSHSYARIQHLCSTLGVAVMQVSQMRRRQQMDAPPTRHDLKESGDIENAARVIVLAWRRRTQVGDRVFCRLDKSTFGGEGTVWSYRRNVAGFLEPHSFNFEEDW